MSRVCYINYLQNVYLKNVRKYNNFVKIVEVGARDGLQNEKTFVPTQVKVDLINRLSDTGLTSIEATSFVSPKWVPQMADSAEVFQQIKKNPFVSYPVLIPNLKGLQDALKVGVSEIAVFLSATETFSRKNTNCSITESIKNMKAITDEARKKNLQIRGYISCVAGCPYEGKVETKGVTHLVAMMLEFGCSEISLGDTIGVGTPNSIRNLLHDLRLISDDMSKFAFHCHDTYGQALVNIYTGLQYGIRIFDSSVAGLGGCPYAAGATGNVSTEDLLYFLNGEGFETGIDFDKIVQIGDMISNHLQRKNQSKTGAAVLSKMCLKK